MSSTSKSVRSDWFDAALGRLARLAELEDNWDSYGAPTPHPIAVESAKLILEVLADLQLRPAGIDPSAEGGVCISFVSPERYGDIECLNSGEILAATSTNGEQTKVWTVGQAGVVTVEKIGAAASVIRSFLAA